MENIRKTQQGSCSLQFSDKGVCLSGAENEVSHGGGDFILKYAQNMQFISPETRNIAPIFHVGRAVILLMLSTHTRLV